MTPNFGPNPPSGDVVPDWFLGGDRRRKILAALVESKGEARTKDELVAAANCGQATVYETLKVLRAVNLVERDSGGTYRYLDGTELSEAVRALIRALAPYEATPTPRAKRNRGRT